jgi:hypothetical protein
MTRQDYLDGKVTHEEFYGSVAKLAGIDLSTAAPNLMSRVKDALADGDEALNTIPLALWDSMARASRVAIEPALKAHGDFWSLAGGVCTLKTAAKLAVRGEV